MQSFDSDNHCLEQSPPFYLLSSDKNGAADPEEVIQYAENGIHRLDSADLICSMYNGMKGGRNVSAMSELGVFPNNLASLETASSSSGAAVEKGQFMLPEAGPLVVSGGGGGAVGNGRYEICGYKEKSTGVHQERLVAWDSAQQSKEKVVRNQKVGHSIGGRGGAAFEADHARWRGEHQRLINDLRSALSYNRNDQELNLLVETIISHYGQLLQIKKAGARSDMFHILFGVWTTPVERSLMWLGGFRSSDLLKVVEKEIQPVSEEELVGICNLQQSCLQREEALSQGMEALHHSFLLSLSHLSSPNVVVYANQMANAMNFMEKIEIFLNQADLLRLHTLQQLQRILTAHQAARALIAINDYKSRLRTLSSLWNSWASVKCCAAFFS